MSHPCKLLHGCIGGGSLILEDSPPFLMGTKMEEITANVSWIAIIVGAVVSFLVGWLWYSEKLFGTKWAEGSKVELGNASEMPISAMVTQVLGLICRGLGCGGIGRKTNALDHHFDGDRLWIAAIFWQFIHAKNQLRQNGRHRLLGRCCRDYDHCANVPLTEQKGPQLAGPIFSLLFRKPKRLLASAVLAPVDVSQKMSAQARR